MAPWCIRRDPAPAAVGWMAVGLVRRMRNDAPPISATDRRSRLSLPASFIELQLD